MSPRIACLALVLGVALSATSCGDDRQSEESQDEQTSETLAPAPSETSPAESSETESAQAGLLMSPTSTVQEGAFFASANGYTYDIEFTVGYDNATSSILNAPVGQTDFSWDWQLDATVTNTTEGRNAPSPARLLSPDPLWPSTSLMCARGADAGDVTMLRYEANYPDDFPFCAATLFNAMSATAENGTIDAEIPAGESIDFSLTGTESYEVEEELGNAMLEAFDEGPDLWIQSGGTLQSSDGGDECLGLAWFSGATAPCDLAVSSGVDDSPLAPFVGTWTGPVWRHDRGESMGGTETMIVAEGSDGTPKVTFTYSEDAPEAAEYCGKEVYLLRAQVVGDELIGEPFSDGCPGIEIAYTIVDENTLSFVPTDGYYGDIPGEKTRLE